LSATFGLRGFRKPGTTSRSGDLARHAARSRLAPYERFRAAEWHTGGRKRRRPREWARVPRVRRVAVHWPRLHAETTFLLRVSPANLHRNKEPTSGLEPLVCSLRVIGQALQGFAEGCRCHIFRRLSLLWVAACCTVLRSRWCQSGVRVSLGAQVEALERIPCGIPLA
jgi:hypothetical protein